MIRATLDLLTMKAFQPDIRNYRMPFGRREFNEAILGVSVHRSGGVLCSLDSQESSKPSLSRVQALDELNEEDLREAMVSYSRKHYLRYAIGLLSYDFTIELRQVPSPSGASEAEVLRNDPAAILGDEVEGGDQYSLIRQTHQPESALVFTYKQSAVRRLEGLSNRSPVSFLQIGGGIEWALSHWLAHSAEKMASRPVDLVLYDYPTITILQIDDRTINPNIFCRTDSSGAPPRESMIIQKGFERYLRSGSRVVLLDISLGGHGHSDDDGLPAFLDDTVGGEDLIIEDYPHPFQLLLEETKS